jgi:hypothetical protein
MSQIRKMKRGKSKSAESKHTHDQDLVNAVVLRLVEAEEAWDAGRLELVSGYVAEVWDGDLVAAEAGYKEDPTWNATIAGLNAHDDGYGADAEVAMSALVLDNRLPPELKGSLTLQQRKGLLPVTDDAKLVELARMALEASTDYFKWMTAVAIQLNKESGRGIEAYHEWDESVDELFTVLHDLGLASVGLRDDALFELRRREIVDFAKLPPDVVRAIVQHGDVLRLVAKVTGLIADAVASPGYGDHSQEIVEEIEFALESFFE